jgi:ABC-type multidrug transport system permease subunit
MTGLSCRKMAPLALLLLVLLGPGITARVFVAPTNPPTTHVSSEAIIGLVGVIVSGTMILITFAQSPSLRRTLKSE